MSDCAGVVAPRRRANKPRRFHVEGYINWCLDCKQEVALRRECKWSYRWRLWEHWPCPVMVEKGLVRTGGQIVMRAVSAAAIHEQASGRETDG
jgi:hypothetical protein